MARFTVFEVGETASQDRTWPIERLQMMPRVGEIVTRADENGDSQAYEVLTVIAPQGRREGDVFLRHIGKASPVKPPLRRRRSAGRKV